MSEKVSNARADDVRAMFARIARRYDLLNRLMTFGRDRAWRREAVARLELAKGQRVLDVGAGTGDLAFTILDSQAGTHVVACDFTREMLAVGRSRPGSTAISWVLADAGRLPFAAASFEGVVSGFLLRNVSALDDALREQVRVLKPGGRLASLDTTPPCPGPLAPLVHFQLRRVIPALGRLVAGDAAAYRYLPRSTEAFASAERLAERLRSAGLAGVQFVRRMLGTIAIHWGRKPEA
jgi:demethylmenaquinone methyltransferase/2-methoxy-6-polyprenyl-1,4-benzoquinol methylase